MRLLLIFIDPGSYLNISAQPDN